MVSNYQQESLAGATGVELIVALYDGAIRFLYQARQHVEDGDVSGRRRSAKTMMRCKKPSRPKNCGIRCNWTMRR